MDSKRGEDLAENTLYTHTLTLNQLRDFCERHGVFFVNDITLSQLTSWRVAWPFESPSPSATTKGGSNPFSNSARTPASSSPTPPGSSQPSRSKRMKPATSGPLNRRNTRPCLPLSPLDALPSSAGASVYAVAAMGRPFPCGCSVSVQGRAVKSRQPCSASAQSGARLARLSIDGTLFEFSLAFLPAVTEVPGYDVPPL